MSILTDPNHQLIASALKRLDLTEEDVEKHGVINAVEAALLKLPQIDDYEVEHYAFPHFIARQALLRAGTIITTERHKTWHPYVISYGEVLVFDENLKQTKHIKALPVPEGHFTSLTEPGTRRLIFVAQDTLWTTFHPCEHDDPNRLYNEAIIPNDNPLIP